MGPRGRWGWGAALVGGALLAYLLFARETEEPSGSAAELALIAARAEAENRVLEGRVRPTEPPVPGRDEPFSLPEPEPPPRLGQLRDDAYAAAVEAGTSRPGEAALREAVRVFIEHNRQFADAQAQAEGLTVEEVEELTFFGMMAQQTQRWPDVEDVLERPIDPAVREAAEALFHDANSTFKAEMRRQVQAGATEAERWALIRGAQEEYRQRYFELTGMNEAQLQALLAGDPDRKYPGGTLPPPEVVAERQEEVVTEPPPRPQEAPPPEEETPIVPDDDGASEQD